MKAFYKIILLLYCCYFSLAATGQNLNLVSPITISMPNNPAANTDDWGKGAQPFIITAKKNTPNELQSWMLVSIKKGGSKICGSNTPQTAPEVYFDMPLKTWVGASAVSLLGNSCVLQPGDYELCVQFYLKDHRTIIGENCKSFTIKESKSENYAPPQNILPAADKILTVQESLQPIQFRWTQIVPKPKAKVKYTLRIWDIHIRGSKNQAIKNQQPIIIKETNELTQLSIPSSELRAAKSEDNSYAWNVEASKTSALGDIEILGTSEATEFSIKTNDAGSLVNQTPVNGKIFTKAETTRPIVFSWTPVLPMPKEKIIYRLRVWLHKSGQATAAEIKKNKPVFETETRALTFGSGPCDTLDRPCLCYACPFATYDWNVEAMMNGKIIAESELSTYSVSSAGCGTNNANVTLTCGKIINGKQTYNGVILFNNIISASGGLQCTTVMNGITSATGTITGLATLPVTIPVGGSSSAINFIYTPASAAAATASFSYQGIWNDGSNNTSNFTTTNVQLPICKKPSDCNCKSAQCTKKLWYKDVSTGIIKEFACSNQTPIILNCDKNYHFFASAVCRPDTNCKMIIKGEFRNAAGALVIQQTLFSNNTAFNIISNTAGNYTFTIRYYINDVECGNCTIPIAVSCNPTVDCCKNSSWVTRYENSNGRIGVPVVLPVCGTKLNSVECNIEKEYFVNYACPQGCGPAQARFQYYNAATNAPVGVAVNAPTQNQTHIFTPGTAGNYYLKIEVFCGGKLCDSCKYPVEVKCTPPVNCCQNATQKDPSIYDAAGTNLATFSCTQPKTYYINAGNKNCDKELIIKASANCGSDPNCGAKIIYTLKNNSTGATITGTGILTILTTLANGAYTLIVDYYCGNIICKTCKFEIIKDCKPVVDDCCKNSSWGEKIHYTSGGFTGGAVPKPMPASGGNLGAVTCGSIKQFKICYNCAQGCGTAQIKYDVYLAYSLVLVSSTTAASCSVANITMPATAGNYQIRITAICNGKECNTMDYFINTECKPVDCCKGGKWTSKSLDWDIKIKAEQAEGTEITDEPVQKPAPQKKKEQKTPAGAKIKPIDLGGGQLNPRSGSIKVAKCGDTLKIAEGNEFTLNAAYTCNTAVANCTGKVIAKVKDPNGITYGTWPLPRLFKFATPGIYTVTYYAYCGEIVCDSCTFYVNAAKDCCKGSEWKKAQYQITNKKPNGDWDKTDQTYYSLPLTITSPITVIKADVAVDLEKLEYSCAQGCTSGFILKRKNITTGVEEVPEMIAAGGTPSVYSKPYPQLITIVPTCGGISCGKPIVFRLECLSKNCIPVCISDTIVFSTGMTTTGSSATVTEPQWFADYTLGILSSGTAPFFGTSGTGGAATILQNVVDVDNITTYKAHRNILVSKNCNINFSGKLGISKSTLDTWATLFKSFKLLKGGPTGTVVWTYVSGTPGAVGTYVTNNFNGTVAVTPDVYTFVFEYYKAGPDWNYNSMFVTGIIVRNILPTSKECCPITNTGNGNPTTTYSQAGHLNGLNLDMDTCSCNGGKWDFGFAINGAQVHWSDLAHSPPYTFTCNPSFSPLKLGLVYICNQNWNCTFNVKLIKKNLTTNIETVVVSENDIISGPTSLFNHSALRTWLYPENDICQYTIIPYCNGKECSDRLVFNIDSKIAQKDNREKDGKGRPASIVYGGTIDRQTVVQKDSADTNGKNNNARKGWDGKVQGKAVSFPYSCTCCGKSIEFTSGQSAVDHKTSCCPPPPTAPTTTVGRAILNNCPPPCDWDTLVPGGAEFRQSMYVLSDGVFNGKKELMSSKEISNEIERKLQLGTGLVFKGAIVQKHKVTGLTVLVAYYTCCRPSIKGDKSGTDDRVEIITIPLKEEKGYLKMWGVAVKETMVAGKTTITNLPAVSSRKHDYVGHVTLLR